MQEKLVIIQGIQCLSAKQSIQKCDRHTVNFALLTPQKLKQYRSVFDAHLKSIAL